VAVTTALDRYSARRLPLSASSSDLHSTRVYCWPHGPGAVAVCCRPSCAPSPAALAVGVVLVDAAGCCAAHVMHLVACLQQLPPLCSAGRAFWRLNTMEAHTKRLTEELQFYSTHVDLVCCLVSAALQGMCAHFWFVLVGMCVLTGMTQCVCCWAGSRGPTPTPQLSVEDQIGDGGQQWRQSPGWLCACGCVCCEVTRASVCDAGCFSYLATSWLNCLAAEGSSWHVCRLSIAIGLAVLCIVTFGSHLALYWHQYSLTPST
jgi:hypothetical protein